MIKTRPKIYFDTSVPSSFYDISAPEQTAITRLFWQEYLKYFSAYISEATLQEIKKTRDLIKSKDILQLVRAFQILKINRAVQDLANRYLKAGIVPSLYPIDALHIACATIYKMDFLITWNISHLANPNRRKTLTEFNAKHSLFIPQLTTPAEIIQTYEKE